MHATRVWRRVDNSSGQLCKQIIAIIGLGMLFHTHIHTVVIRVYRKKGWVESTYLLINPYPFLTLNHLTVPKTFVAVKKTNYDILLIILDASWYLIRLLTMTKCKIRTDHEKVTHLMWKINITPNCHSYYRSWRLEVSCASCIWCEASTIMSTMNEYHERVPTRLLLG